MAIVNIKKINIVFPNNLKERVLDLLQEKSIAQVDDFEDDVINKYNKEDDIKCIDCEYQAAEAQFAINFLEKYKKKKKQSLLKKLRDGNFLKIDKTKYQKTIKDFNYQEIINKCKDLGEQINLHQNKITELTDEKNRYLTWQNLKTDFSQNLETEHVKTVIGSIKATDYDRLTQLLASGDENFDLAQVDVGNTETKIIFSYLKNKEEVFTKILHQVDFKEADLSGLNTTISAKLKELDKNIENHQQENQVLVSTAKKLAEHQDNLKIIFDYYTSKLAHQVAKKRSLNLNFVSIINAWVPEKKIESLKKDLTEVSDQVSLYKVNLKKGEEPPVAIKNSNLLEPLESVTNLYGLPKASELDPTWWLSLSFLVFFGFCLSDAGYGLLLTAVSLLAIKILKIPREKQTLMRLIAYAGVFTFIIGALFGGWFGINLDGLAPSWIRDLLLKIRLINPMKDPLIVMYISFGLGFVHILWGLIAKFYQGWRDKQYTAAILDTGLWLYFLPVLAYWAITQSATGKILVLVGVAALILTQGRSNKNIVVKFLVGVLSLYNLVGYFSDVLSYSRLLALGLATGVIASIVNQIAGMVGDMIPYVGWLFMILIIIVGHLFNLVINVLGSYIHSSRLEFVEFFGKFMEGGGRVFEPFRKRFKYINLINN